MKIIWVDNFNRESVADRLVAENIRSEREVEIMVEALQATCTESGPNWYRTVPDDYRLSRGMADLVGDITDDESEA